MTLLVALAFALSCGFEPFILCIIHEWSFFLTGSVFQRELFSVFVCIQSHSWIHNSQLGTLKRQLFFSGVRHEQVVLPPAASLWLLLAPKISWTWYLKCSLALEAAEEETNKQTKANKQTVHGLFVSNGPITDILWLIIAGILK